MRHPQVLVYESDGRLADVLRPLAEKNKWLLREPRQLSACLRLLDRGGPGVLVLRTHTLERELATLTRNLERDLTTLKPGESREARARANLERSLERQLDLLEQVSWLHPEAATVLVADGEQAWLSGLAWDLGVSWVLLPPQTRERLAEMVANLMGRYQPATAEGKA
ncbi:MAG TPA: hypothetical protein VH643_16500 [Gemmataceae bacterium]